MCQPGDAALLLVQLQPTQVALDYQLIGAPGAHTPTHTTAATVGTATGLDKTSREERSHTFGQQTFLNELERTVQRVPRQSQTQPPSALIHSRRCYLRARHHHMTSTCVGESEQPAIAIGVGYPTSNTLDKWHKPLAVQRTARSTFATLCSPA